jgi:hypothetical protein
MNWNDVPTTERDVFALQRENVMTTMTMDHNCDGQWQHHLLSYLVRCNVVLDVLCTAGASQHHLPWISQCGRVLHSQPGAAADLQG